MIDYEAARKEMPKLKAKLTRAKNSKDPAKVLAVVQEAYTAFDRWGAYPDNWHLFKNAEDDAKFATARGLQLR